MCYCCILKDDRMAGIPKGQGEAEMSVSPSYLKTKTKTPKIVRELIPIFLYRKTR